MQVQKIEYPMILMKVKHLMKSSNYKSIHKSHGQTAQINKDVFDSLTPLPRDFN